MKNLNAILTLLLFASVVNSVLIYKRIDIMSCRLDVATARIDLLNGTQIERPSCLDTLAPQRTHEVGGTT